MSSCHIIRTTCRSVSKKSQLGIVSRSFSAASSGYTFDEPLHPNYTIQSVKPPKYWAKPPDEPEDPMAYKRKPVSSAHAIDFATSPPKLSAKDSCAISPSGTVIHGRYGELDIDASAGIPLEYLALLHPAAEGAAALRTVASGATEGTLLVYGAGEASAMATVQLASSSGLAVVGVVGGSQSGNSEFVEALKGMTNEPGAIVPEEFAIIKSAFKDIVNATVSGGEADINNGFDPDLFAQDFQKNLLKYAEYFPEGKLSPNAEDYSFSGKEKDRKEFDANISAYLSQFQKGSPSFDENVLKEVMTKEQYAIFKSKFGKQSTAVITGDDDADSDFNPAVIAKQITESPETISEYLKEQTHSLGGEFCPYEFSVLKNQILSGVEMPKGGPVLGAVINVTPELAKAVEAAAKGKTLRAKAEALHFLTDSEKNAFAAANAVASLANQAGKPVVVVGGSLPGFKSVTPTDADVKEALSAMSLDEDGSSRLNYFLQVYRASDYPVYADYAIHRSQESLSGPRQIVVTK
jgi:hypothetical protein